jgi:flagellin FlaB
MKAFSGSEEAFTGLEAAIVLIAFVVVAAVFAYVVLGAGFFTTQKSQEVVHTGVEAASANIEILGDVYGRQNATLLNSIGFLNFTVGLAAGGTSIDMDRIAIVYSNASGRWEITQTAAMYGTPQAQYWTIIDIDNGDTDSLMEAGEHVDIAVALKGPWNIVPNDPFTVEVQPGVGAALSIKRKGPASIDAVQRLY